MWLILERVNDYNQYGEYFVAAFDHKPQFQELKDLLNLSDETTVNLLKGGGAKLLKITGII